MARATDETIVINFDVMSSVTYQGEKLSEYQIEKLKKSLKDKIGTLIYEEVLDICDDEGDSGLTDYVCSFTDVQHID